MVMKKHSGIAGTKLGPNWDQTLCWLKLLISSPRASTWRRLWPQRRSSGGAHSGGGNTERAAKADGTSASSWHVCRAAPRRYLRPLHLLPFAPPPFTTPALLSPQRSGRSSGGEREPASSTWSLPAAHLLPPQAHCVCGLFEVPPLMGTSHFRRLARGVHLRCHAAYQLSSIFSVCLKE